MPGAEDESLRICDRVTAELHLLVSQINELPGQLTGSANALCDDQEEISLLIV